MLRVLIVDDHAAFRQALAFMLDREPDFHVVAQAASLAEARRVRAPFDLTLLDLMLPDGDGVDFVRELRAANPQSRIVVLTIVGNRLRLARAVQAGAAGVIDKLTRVGELIAALRRLARGEALLSPSEVSALLRLLDEPQP